MKRETIYLTCLILALSPTAYVFAAADAEIPATGSSITIDGIKEAAWSSAPPHAIANVVQGAASKTGCSGSWRALWDSQYLYVFIDVNDNKLVSDSTGKYDDDSAEIFVDIGNDKATSYAAGANDYQYRFAWDATKPAIGMDHGNTTTGIDFVLLTTGTNYALEVRFPWTLLYQNKGGPALGDLMGFEAQINDDDDGGSRDNQLDWHSTTNDAWQNPSLLGTVVLVAGYTPRAVNPKPADKATDVFRDTVLSWAPGPYADTHDVYFGTTFQDVNNASRTAPGTVLVSKGQSDTTYDPGRLEFGTTYYWRVDEVNAPPSTAIYKGDVWSFTVETYSIAIAGVTAEADSDFDASSVAQKTVDGSGLTGDQHSTTPADMWISGKVAMPHWIQYTFDKVYKLDQMSVWNSNQVLENLLGFGAKDVFVQYSLDGANWTDLGNFVFTRAPGTPTYVADTKVSFGGVAAKYVKLTINSNWGGLFPQASLSEVRFYSIPVAAREPSPTAGATNLNPQVTLSWRAGREAASHEVYVGTDPDAVVASTTPTATTTQAQYEVPLDLAKTYYWKVVEVNQTETPTGWPSDVWSFSTAAYISIDDFESYANDSPKRVFQTWIDGGGFSPDEYFPNGGSGNGTGSLVGYDPTLGDIMQTTYFYGGRQSMPLYYDNSAAPKVSEAVRTLDPAKDTTDWTKYGLTTLVLWLRGDSANGAAPIYVKINNTKVLYNNGAAATTMPIWKPFQVDLASVPASDLNTVKTITIGVGDGSVGGTGTIFVDEIRLYATAPQIAVPTDPGTNGLEALYAMERDVKDSSGKGRDGTLNGEPAFTDGKSGKALAFDGTNDYVDLPIGNLLSTLGRSTFAAWVNFGGGAGSWQRVFDFGTGTNVYMFLTPRQGTAGAMRTAITTSSNGGEQGVNGPIALPSGWHHVAVVFDDAAMRIRLYMDGVEVGSGTTTLLPKNLGVTTQNWLGRSQWSGDAYLTGSIDDFRIYSRPLSEGEIRYLAGDR
jgi:hypothetical protein